MHVVKSSIQLCDDYFDYGSKTEYHEAVSFFRGQSSQWPSPYHCSHLNKGTIRKSDATTFKVFTDVFYFKLNILY